MKRLATISALVLALSLAGCATPEKQPDVPSKDTLACELSGQRLVIRFLPDEVRMVSPEGDPVVLQKVPAASGVRYTNGLIEIRGGGGPISNPGRLVYIRDGNGWTLENCAPLMVPGAAK